MRHVALIEHYNRRTFIVLWLALAVLFIGANFGFLFLRAHYEGGDFAANALQIRKAKHFQEIYGNYSRFGFHHPGPAFFYVYALGEAVLFDALHVVPAPFNAHVIAGILLQTGFFAWGLAIVARRAAQTSSVGLLLLFAGLHFALVSWQSPSASFQNIWPPYVLLCPFFCFLVACASVASGSADFLALAIAGCFLVHGHVAQPLFVAPMAGVAYISFWVRRRRDEFEHGNLLRPHLLLAGVILLALLPLAIDLTKGSGSNLIGIIREFSGSHSDRKTLPQSLTYLAAFAFYIQNTDTLCARISRESLQPFVQRSGVGLVWLGIALLTAVGTRRYRDSSSGLFRRTLLIFFSIALALTIVWGTLQQAEMFAFNAYFNYAILLVPFIGAALATGSLTSVMLRRAPVVWGCWIVSVAVWVWVANNYHWGADPPHRPTGTVEQFEQVCATAAADRQRVRRKFLSFTAHGNWEWAAAAALALERCGYDYAVDPTWAFIFDREHGADLETSLQKGKVALWRIRSPAEAGDRWCDSSVPQIDPGAHSEITFAGTEANAGHYVISGWDVSTGPFSWSIGKEGALYFLASTASTDVEMIVSLFPATFSGAKSQNVSLSFNGHEVGHVAVERAMEWRLLIPRTVWNEKSTACATFTFPDAISPVAAGVSSDGREISCGFTSIEFRSAAARP